MKVVFFTVADQTNLRFAEGLKRSFKHFHPELEFRIYGPEYCATALAEDSQFFYKQKPWIMRNLMQDYDLVVGLDADSVVTGKLDHILEDTSYEVGTVLNFNQRDAQKFGQVSVWDIPAQEYKNCGLVAVRSRALVDHWWSLCNSVHFPHYRFREQDLLNILYSYGNYRGVCFDQIGDTWNGLISKDFWMGVELVDGQLVVRFINEKKEVVGAKTVKVLHWAEGNAEQKMNFDLVFPQDVARYLKELTQYETA